MRPVTTNAAVPVSVSSLSLANVVAFTVTVSPDPLAVIEVASEPVVIVTALSAASPVVTVSVPVTALASTSPTSPVTTKSAEPDSVSSVFCASAAAFTVTVSFEKLSVIEVAADPVVMVMLLSLALPTVAVSVPVTAEAFRSPLRPVTTNAAEPDSVSTILLAKVVALTVMMSLPPFAVIDVAAEPVVMVMPLSAALPVVTVSVPLSADAFRSPTRPSTTNAAVPVSVSRVFCASTDA